MARPTDKSVFVQAVSALGGRASNRQLQVNLSWPEDKYWRIHQELFDEGAIEKGRGKGGTVLLVARESQGLSSEDVTSVATETNGDIQTEIVANELNIQTPESDLYDPVQKQLQKNWALSRQLDECHCEIVASQGRRDTGGSWSRPDLCVIGSRKFEHYPDRVFELHTFEVKASYDVTIKGVLEALAHREAATRSYVLYHTATKDFSSYPESLRIQELAGRHGVGVIIAGNIDDYGDWEEIVPAQRALSDPEAVNTFIGRSLSEEAKRKIRRWFSW